MRWFHLSVIALFAAAIILFAAQNLQLVTMSFLGFSATVPHGAVWLLSCTSSAWRLAAASSRWSVG